MTNRDFDIKPLTDEEREFAGMLNMDETEYALLKDVRNIDDWHAYVEMKAQAQDE